MSMSDEVKNLIWELVEPQLEMYNRMNLPVERTLLEHKVLDIFQTIEEQEETTALNAFHDGYHDGNIEAQDTIEELQNQIQRVIENLRDTAFTLEREYGR